MTHRYQLKMAALMGLAIGLFALPGNGQKKPSKSVYDGVYTADQAKRGTTAFNSTCAMCHGESMQGGGGAPAAAGPEFMFSWGGKNAGELFTYLKGNMPPGGGGTLSDQRYADIMAAIFKTNEFPEGKSELTAENASDVEISKEKPTK